MQGAAVFSRPPFLDDGLDKLGHFLRDDIALVFVSARLLQCERLTWNRADVVMKSLQRLGPYDPQDVEQAVKHFDDVVKEIQAQNFTVISPPDKKVCDECDFRNLCASDGTIQIRGSKK